MSEFPKLCANQILPMKYGDTKSSCASVVQDSFPSGRHRLQPGQKDAVCPGCVSRALGIPEMPSKTLYVCAVFSLKRAHSFQQPSKRICNYRKTHKLMKIPTTQYQLCAKYYFKCFIVNSHNHYNPKGQVIGKCPFYGLKN